MKRIFVIGSLALLTLAAACGSSDDKPTAMPEPTTQAAPVDAPTPVPSTPTPVPPTPTKPPATSTPIPLNSTALSGMLPTLPAIIPTTIAGISTKEPGTDFFASLTPQQAACLEEHGVTEAMVDGIAENVPPPQVIIGFIECNLEFSGSDDVPAFTAENLRCLQAELGEDALEDFIAMGSDGDTPSLEQLRALVACGVDLSEQVEQASDLTVEQLDCIIASEHADDFELLISGTGGFPDLGLVSTLAECGVSFGTP